MDERRPTDSSEPGFHGPAEIISSNAAGAVALCGCGHLHVNLQYITLRFERAAFGELAALLTSAQRRLDANASLQAPAAGAIPAAVH
jgi:hypothetical protein